MQLNSIKSSIKYLLIFLFVGVQINAAAQVNKVISLDGTWDIIFDDLDEGVANKWYLNANFELQNSREISVPSCWESFEKDYEGVGIYRKKFIIPEDWDGRIINLNFEAVNYYLDVNSCSQRFLPKPLHFE